MIHEARIWALAAITRRVQRSGRRFVVFFASELSLTGSE
jgi:hypothetical protein